MQNAFSRTELLLGPEAMKRLAGCRVAVFGIGGVGDTRWRRWPGPASARWT